MVATGNPWKEAVKTEIIDLNSYESKCNNLPDFPLSLRGSTGGYVSDSSPLICGGYDKNDHTMSDCYVIDGSQSPIGQMLESRRSASSLGKKKVKNHPIAAL